MVVNLEGWVPPRPRLTEKYMDRVDPVPPEELLKSILFVPTVPLFIVLMVKKLS